MTDSIYTISFFIIASGMTIIAGISAYLYRERDGQFEAASKRCKKLADENEQYETALATSEATVKGLKETQAQLERIISDLSAERSTLYFRNAKWQIEPITPKPRKPHTLKHGMTVKDPTEAQAKRIFREAKRAGLISNWEGDVTSKTPNVWFGRPRGIDIVSRCIKDLDKSNIYITPTEFIRRIRGEQE